MARMSWKALAVVAVVAALASSVGAASVMAARASHLGDMLDLPRCPLADVQTGDVVLFRWDGTDLVHDLVSTFSHVGLVVLRGTEPWILETHRDGDGLNPGGSGGVRAYPLKHRTQTYPGAAWVLRLDRERWSVRAEDVEAALPDLFHRPYDYGHKSRLASCFADSVLGLGGRSHGAHSMFCSEFVGELLRHAGVLPNAYNTACLTPESFVHLTVDSHPVFPHMHRL